VTCCALDAKEEILRRGLLLRIGYLSDPDGDGVLLESKADRRSGGASCVFGLVGSLVGDIIVLCLS